MELEGGQCKSCLDGEIRNKSAQEGNGARKRAMESSLLTSYEAE
jgi:hypothetical protein